MKRSIYIAFLFWLVTSCTAGKTDNSPLERALQAAAENRGELEKVLAHYAQDPTDSLKLKAARFLIGHDAIINEYDEFPPVDIPAKIPALQNRLPVRMHLRGRKH